MALIPPAPPAVTPEMLSKWNDLQDRLKKIKVEEILLRKEIYGFYFTNPEEGTNTVDLDVTGFPGWKLKAVRGIDRKIDLPVLMAAASGTEQEPSALDKAGIRKDLLVEWEPKLVIREYRKLTNAQLEVFDQCLTIKDGSPQLTLVPPKEEK